MSGQAGFGNAYTGYAERDVIPMKLIVFNTGPLLYIECQSGYRQSRRSTG